MKRTPLPRSTTPLARSPLPQRRKPLRSVSAKRRKLAPARKRCREAVILRSGGLCEAKGFSWQCKGYGEHVHEKLTRARGGNPNDPDNCLYVCSICHDHIHLRLAAAEAAGLLLSQHAGRGRA
jgi:hypothetical protein